MLSYYCLYFMTLLGMAGFGLQALLQAIFSWKSYSHSRENLLECFILAGTLGYLVAVDFDIIISRHFAAWSVFFGWIKLSLLIGRFPNIGIYIYMSVHVVKSLFVFILVGVAQTNLPSYLPTV